MTSLQKFNYAFYLLNIIICSVVLLDCFVVGTFTETEICKEKKASFGRSRSGATEWRSNLIRSFSNTEYYIPKSAFSAIAENNSFTIHRTNVFRKAIGVSYADSEYFYYQKMGVVNSSWLGILAVLLPLIASSALLFFTLKYNKKFERRHAVLLTVICLLLVYFYFIVQS